MDDTRCVGVVGCGVMGAGIAELCAARKLDVVLIGRRDVSIQAAKKRLTKSLERGLKKGRITESEHTEIWSSLSFTTDFAALADRDMVIECVREDEYLKRDVFTTIDRAVTGVDTVLASCTSSIPVMKLARATSCPSRVIGTHFFNPAAAMPLVEVVPTLLTDEQTLLRAELFLTDVLGKQVVRSPDRSGFVVNALLVPYLLSAVRMLESGFATAADVDRAMVLGCGHPMGPLTLIDLIGLDIIADVANALYDEFKEPHYAPPALLSRMVDAGLLGKKTGVGFHNYNS